MEASNNISPTSSLAQPISLGTNVLEEGIRQKRVELSAACLSDKIGNYNERGWMRQLRKWITGVLFVVILLWLASIQTVFILTGRDILHYGENVIIAYLTTTTANIIGLFSIVMYWLFGRNKKS